MFKRPFTVSLAQSAPRLRRRVVAAMLGSLLLSPGCAAFRPLRGVPASHVPEELLGETREGRRTINLSMLVRQPVPQHRVEGGDILAIYIPGLLGSRSLMAPALGRESVGDVPPITAPANNIDPPSAGYPVTVRDDQTIKLPQLDPIDVGGMTLREVETAILDACRRSGVFQATSTQVMVSLWRPREYRVMVVRQEASTSGGTMSGQGMINPGVTKRGTGQIVRLRAYENDVLHALTASTGGNNGLPGLDAENAIYVIRKNRTGRGCPPEYSAPVEVSVPQSPTPLAAPESRVPEQFPLNAPPQSVPYLPPQAGQVPPVYADQVPPVSASPDVQRGPMSNPYPAPMDEPVRRPMEELPPPAAHSTAPNFGNPMGTGPGVQPQPYVVPERIQYGTPQNGLPIIPQKYEVIRGQSPSPRMGGFGGGHSIQRSASAPQARPVAPQGFRTAEYGRQDQYSAPVRRTNGTEVPEQVVDDVPQLPTQASRPIHNLFPEQFNYEDLTIDSPNVIRIPVRLAPGETPNITEEDITLYDGDIVFIESRDTEVFYTGGLLGGGEYELPRDRDLTVTEAISVAQSRVGGGGGTVATNSSGGVSALNSDVTISPSRVIIRRRLPDGRVLPIEVDLYRARLTPEEDIIIQPRDLVLLQYKGGEATLAFIERHLLAGALFGVAAAQLTTGSK